MHSDGHKLSVDQRNVDPAIDQQCSILTREIIEILLQLGQVEISLQDVLLSSSEQQ